MSIGPSIDETLSADDRRALERFRDWCRAMDRRITQWLAALDAGAATTPEIVTALQDTADLGRVITSKFPRDFATTQSVQPTESRK